MTAIRWIFLITGAVIALTYGMEERGDDANDPVIPDDSSSDDDHDEDADDADQAVGLPGARRHQKSYSLNQKIDFIDTYQLEHAIGLPHAETATSFARHHRIAPHTFRRWISTQDELFALRDRSTQAQRRQRRQRQHGTDEQCKVSFKHSMATK